MPLVRMTTSVACDDLPDTAGAEIQLSPERAQQVVEAGWAELVRSAAPETPESRVAAVEHAVQRAPATEPQAANRRRRTRRGGDDGDHGPGDHEG